MVVVVVGGKVEGEIENSPLNNGVNLCLEGSLISLTKSFGSCSDMYVLQGRINFGNEEQKSKKEWTHIV